MPTTTSSRFNSASTNEAIRRPAVDAAGLAGPGRTRPEQRGRAIAAMVLAVFAFSWTGWGLSSRAHPALGRPVQAASALCLLIVLAGVGVMLGPVLLLLVEAVGGRAAFFVAALWVARRPGDRAAGRRSSAIAPPSGCSWSPSPSTNSTGEAGSLTMLRWRRPVRRRRTP